MASANYVTWYLVEMYGVSPSHFKICKTPKERDAYITELSDRIAEMQIPNSDRPMISVRIDRHVVPSGPIR